MVQSVADEGGMKVTQEDEYTDLEFKGKIRTYYELNVCEPAPNS